MVDPGWYPDPSRRSEWRYWDGQHWTAHVAMGGTTASDEAGDWPPPGQPVRSRAEAGWYRDPAGRYEWRYWEGSEWSEHVSRAGLTGVDRLHPSVHYDPPAFRTHTPPPPPNRTTSSRNWMHTAIVVGLILGLWGLVTWLQADTRDLRDWADQQACIRVKQGEGLSEDEARLRC